MNTYLLGYAPLIKKQKINSLENDQERQEVWVKKNVKYYFEPSYDVNIWQHFLDDLVIQYQGKISTGLDYKLVIYFHNLDYDAQYFFQQVVDKNFPHDVNITNIIYNSSLYSVTFEYLNCVFELRDSMKIYNQSLAALGKNVGWSKQTEKATYSWFNLDKTSQRFQDELYYFKFDIAVLSAVMSNHFIKLPGKAKLTAAAYAESDLKSTIRKYDKQAGTSKYGLVFKPKLSAVNQSYIRSAYFGGFVYANRNLLNQKLKRGLVADVNSLYPSVMLNRDYPDWSSLRDLSKAEFERLQLDDYYTYGIVTINIKKLQIHPDGVPVIPKKEAFGQSREIYDISDLDDTVITVTTLDLFHIKNNYDIEYTFITGLIADKFITAPFREFVLKHKAEKELAVKNHNKVDKLIAKIHLNSSYGKFAQREIDTTHVLTKKSDGSIGYAEIDDPDDYNAPKNILIAVWVTAFARDVLFRAIEQIKQSKTATLWYCDTDAVHFGYTGKLDPVTQAKEIFEEIKLPYSENIFGKWKPEQHMSEAVYLGSKRYWEQDPVAGKAIIKGAGIQKLGKDYLVQQGIDKFRYLKDETLIVPFQASKKVIGGVKIFRTIKKIEPNDSQQRFLKLI